ncbi:MAG: cytochrome c oxidase subunit 3 [Alphaproteobacteria bacterium]|nr:cytochrome c oxidase subunit 3 [Alphaproteobacteria bacterium]
MSGEVKHDYHLVDPSPWPALGALAGFTLAFGLVLFMHEDMMGGIGGMIGIGTIVPGVLLLLATMIFWWRDVIDEATFQGHHKPVVQLGLRYGMFLFIASEVMFFAAFFWAFFDSSLWPRVDPAVWPPEGVETFDPWGLPLINTIILLTSSGTVTLAHKAVERGDKTWSVNWLIVTVALGALFTVLQAYEYVHAPFGFADGIYSSTFYMATGFHGFHVIVGTIFLTVCLFRAIKGHFKPTHHFGFEAAAWYWHFVDVVWIFLFSCVYIWGG